MSAKRDIFGLRTRNKDEDMKLLRPPSFHNVTMSPMKSCMNFVVENSPKTTLNPPLKSPSPKKPIQRSLACRNIGILLKTPEKVEHNDGGDVDIEEQNEESVATEPINVPTKKRRAKSKAATTSEGVGNNFVRINLRRKVFAPQSRSNFKRKWPKKKKRNNGPK